MGRPATKTKLTISQGKSYGNGRIIRRVDRIDEDEVSYTVTKGVASGNNCQTGSTGTVKKASFIAWAQREVK